MREKTVYDKSTVAHHWANQIGDYARVSCDNFYFRNKTIYSYGSHFPIAKHIENAAGEKAVLFTERTYSNTTAKHISITRQAARHLNIIYCYSPNSSHNENFLHWQAKAEGIARNLEKAKKPEKYLSEIGYVAGHVNEYAAFFGIAVPDTLAAVLSIGNKAEFASYLEKKRVYLLAEEKKAKRKYNLQHQKALKKWLNGESDRLYTNNGNDYLRLKDDRIETSQCVQIPLELGKKIWHQVKSKTLAVGQKILGYEVNEVGKIVKVGCHTFKSRYLIDFGEKIFH